MIRRLLAAWLCGAVYFAAFWAPFVHAHPDDRDTDHHRPRAIHAHFSQHHSQPASGPGTALGDDDHDRAVFLQVFLAVAAAPLDTPAPAAPMFELVVPPEMPAHPWVDAVYGHDPPAVSSEIPRAPPACLS